MLFENMAVADKTLRAGSMRPWAAVQCKISYPTALKAYDLIRYSILASAQDAQELLGGEIEIDESFLAADARVSVDAVLPLKCLYLAFTSEMGLLRLKLSKM